MRELFVTNTGSHMWSMNKPESDIDLYTVRQESTRSILTGEPDLDSYVTGYPGEPGKIDRQTHEIGRVVQQVLKGNWNHIVGVMSPLIIKDWEHLAELRTLVEKNLSRQCYHSIHGLAVHNYHKYILNERDDSPKRCQTITRTIRLGCWLLTTGKLVFDPVEEIKPSQIPEYIDLLDHAYQHSILPEQPEHRQELHDWLYNLRINEALWKTTLIHS